MDEIVRLENVGVSYDGKQVLDSVSFSIPRGAITVIVGPSGCGKSTLLRTINRTIEEDLGARWTGDILFDGLSTRTLSCDDLRTRVGMVFQAPSPFPFSVYKNMTYALKYHGMRDKRELKRVVIEKLQMAGLYDEVKDELNRNASTLSGGQQQRLCIARALTVNPDVLLLDEPCSALDALSTQKIEETLLRMKDDVAIVLVTHDSAAAKRLGDNLVYIDEGSVKCCGAIDDVCSLAADEKVRAYLRVE